MKNLVKVALALACAMSVSACGGRRAEAPGATAATAQVRAVSLKLLQEKLKACQPQGSCPDELLLLGGIKRLSGVVADQASRDLILLGEADEDSPPLHLEDFVLALRNAWLSYAPLEGGVYQYSYPGCSIDPNPQVIQRLQAVGHKVFGAPSDEKGMERTLSEWGSVCESPQAVRVIGIPFDTHFAQVMVQADYDMKLLADGSDALDTPGFQSVADMEVERARGELLGGQKFTIPPPVLNRFWLFPGENVYEEGQGVVLIKSCPIRLLTEQMHTNGGRSLVGSGSADSRAQVFAESFTALYPQVAQRRPVYAELENLFRFVALAQVIRHKSQDAWGGFDLSYLLEGYPVARAPVEHYLKGRHSFKELKQREESPSGYRELHLWFPSCGGVDISIKVDGGSFKPGVGEDLARIEAAVLKGRAAADAPVWVLSSEGAEAVSAAADNSRLFQLNRDNKEARLFTVEDRKSSYALFDGERGRPFDQNEISELVAEINRRAAADRASLVYLDLKGFATPDKVEGFATSCRNQQVKLNKEVTIRTLERRRGSTDSQDAFFTPGNRVDKDGSRVEEVKEGKYQGWKRVVLKFFVQVKGVVHSVSVYVYVKSAESAQLIFDTFMRNSGLPEFRASTLADAVNKTLKELRQQEGWSEEQIQREIEDQFGDVYVVQLPAARGAAFG